MDQLKRPGTPNFYLVCPLGFAETYPDQVAPVFPFPIKVLHEKCLAIIQTASRVEITRSDGNVIEYIQRSLICGFPDNISIHLIRIDEHSSTIAIASRARYGYYDFGVNKRRVRRLISSLLAL